ncbi:patatin-like phospholipase family protein [Kocuria oceani]|uniref:patatin-like phospholipase family protein n=1 Tax=Kocuria oceani TaxID=988827 RepID=UPI004036B279
MEQYADLVLEGGGVKGIALVGAIEVPEERGYRFKRVAGTSAGSIVGALVAAGVPAKELVRIMDSVRYPDFRDGTRYTRHTAGKALGILARNGIYLGEHLRSWLQSQLDEYGVRTFADLHYTDDERPPAPERAFKLVVTASDISRGRLRYLPWDYDDFGRDRGAQHVVEAVRATDFDLTDDDRDFLYRSGRDAAVRFLDGTPTRPAWDFPQYIAAHRS